jgi:hypothetical protein
MLINNIINTENIEKILKKLDLFDDAIDNEFCFWGDTPEDWIVHLDILLAGGAIDNDLFYSLFDDEFNLFDDTPNYSCSYINLDGSICGKNTKRVDGCKNHWNRKNRGPGKPCKKCGKLTRIANEFCGKHNGGKQYIQHKRKQ